MTDLPSAASTDQSLRNENQAAGHAKMLTDLGVAPCILGGGWRFELTEEQVIWFSDAVRAYERERLARYLDRAAAGARATAATGLLSDEITANAWTEAAGWCRDKTIWNDRNEEGLRAD